MFKEFKEFVMRGNVMDMAIGIVLGGAFGKIVSYFVKDVLMPPLGMLLGAIAGYYGVPCVFCSGDKLAGQSGWSGAGARGSVASEAALLK